MNNKKRKQTAGIMLILIFIAIYMVGFITGIKLGIICIIGMLLTWAWVRGNLTITYDPGPDYEISGLEKVTRFEVIDETGRLMVEYLSEDVEVTAQLQDRDETLKIFLRHKEEEHV